MKLIVDTYVYLGYKDMALRGDSRHSPAVNEGKVRVWGRPGRCEGKNKRKRGQAPAITWIL